MAETDGNPRFRKSKPPKGGSSRNSRPNAKARKRAALRDTLPNGGAIESDPNTVTPVSGVQVPQPEQGVVKTTMPTVIRTDSSADALAETHADPRPPAARSTAPIAGGKPGPQPRTIRSALGSTLRMELTVHKGEGAEPRFEVRNTAPRGHVGSSDARQDHPRQAPPVGPETMREGPKRSRKPTQPGFAPASPDPSARSARVDTSGVSERPTQPRFDETLRRGSDFEPGGYRNSFGAPPMSTTGDSHRPRRPRRPGERTLIMTRRPNKGSKRDWVFVVLLVAALGLTASMFLSQQAPAEEVVDASAYADEDPQDQEAAQDPFAANTLRPWNAREPDPNASDQRQSDTNALTAREPALAANSVQATELRSEPSGAEVIAGNAVVGSTPVRVARGTTDMVYVLRLVGHESKIVRVGPNSPPSIVVQLAPLAPAPAAQPDPAAPSGTPELAK